MAGLIPRQFIDDMIARTDIVQLIDSRVKLKKAGRNYQACCPFHTEKTPSFSVSPDKQFYHCFGCGASGNVISFLMEYERLEFVDAIEELASIHNLDVPKESKAVTPEQQAKYRQQQNQKQDDFALMENASRYFQTQLRQHPEKNKVIDYLKQRGLTGDIAKQFTIGFAPDGWHNLTAQYGKNQAAASQMVDLGLAKIGQNNKAYDLFRDRLMFPIRDRRGRVIGFGGRVLGEGTPKYLNSPETRVFHKGLELYGFYEAKKADLKLNELIVVEGYMDVVALAQHGISNAVASLGTSTTSDQLQLMFRSVKNVVCCYDGDRAGREAAWRALENALPLMRDGLSLKFVFLPDGEDPDTMVRQQGADTFRHIIADATPLSEYLLSNLSQSHNTSSVEGKSAFVDAFEVLVSKMPDSNLKESLIDLMASRVGAQGKQLERISKSQAKTTSFAPPKETKKSPIRLAIALLLEQPKLAELLPDVNALAQINLPGIDLLSQLLTLCQQRSNMTSAHIMEYFRNTEQGKHLEKLLCWEHHTAPEAAENVFIDILEKLLNTYVEQRTESLLQKERSNAMTREERQELLALLKAQSQ